MTTTHRRRFGFKRWIVIGLFVLGGYFGFGLGGVFKPVSPPVILPPEPFLPGLYILPAIPPILPEPTPLSNTIVAVAIADVALIGLALSARRVATTGKLAAGFLTNLFEWIVELLWNMTEGAAGKWAKAIFPVMATIFLLVFTANMIKLLPGFESIGYLEQAHGTIKGYAPVHLFGNVYTIDGTHEVAHVEGEASSEGGEHGLCDSCIVVPFLRATATDLNFTFALAIVAVVMTQYFGFRALGGTYLTKFINTGTMISKPLVGFIDFGVGLLELVSEFAKILSFGFRLFGNIFAGGLLLAILGALTVIIVPSMLYGLEFFVGIIQAYVFSMLALTFMAQATISHHAEEHGEGHSES